VASFSTAALTVRAACPGLNATWRLLDAVEEADHTFLQELGGTLVVVGQAVVSEQMPIAWIEERLRTLDRLDKLACGRSASTRSATPSSSVANVLPS
jgi:hypothetical protein